MPDESPTPESILMTALDKHTPEERAAYLDIVCHGDTELRRQVERLPKVEPKVGEFLEKSPLEDLADDPANESSLRQEPAQTADAATACSSGPNTDVPLDFLRPCDKPLCDKPDRIGLLGPYDRGGRGPGRPWPPLHACPRLN